MKKISDFWEWFVTESDDIYENLENKTSDIALAITEHLKQIEDDIEFEIPFDFMDKKRQLIISADGEERLFPLVEEIVHYAPQMSKWDIIAFRPRLHQKNQIIDLDGISMDYSDILFQYSKEENCLILDVYINKFDGKDNRYIHLYFLLLDSLIGEFDSVKMIKETRIYPLKNRENLLQFTELLPLIDALKERYL